MRNISLSIPITLTLAQAESLKETLEKEIKQLRNNLSDIRLKEIENEFSREYQEELTLKISKFFKKINQINFPDTVCCGGSGVGFKFNNHRVSFRFFDGKFLGTIERSHEDSNYLPNRSSLNYSDDQKDFLFKCLINGIGIKYKETYSGPTWCGVHISNNPPPLLIKGRENYSNVDFNSHQGEQDLKNWIQDWKKF